jgi:uncharacterized protein (TIGR02145 family)
MPGRNSLNVPIYGYLYNWWAASVVCPIGWHLPSESEWRQLTDYISSQPSLYNYAGGNAKNIAKSLASTVGWISGGKAFQEDYFNEGAVCVDPKINNKTGFFALPAGIGNKDGSADGVGSRVVFWSATNMNGHDYAIQYGGNSYSTIGFINKSKDIDFSNETSQRSCSVRCLRDSIVSDEINEDVEKDHIQTMEKFENCGTMEDTEGNTYRTVQIGTQCWSAENMRSHCDNKGNPLFVGVSDEPSDYYFLPYFFNPSNNPRKYGYLYNWRAALEICPEGWHLPSKEEWEKLIDYVKSNSDYCCDGKTKNTAKSFASNNGWNEATGKCQVGNDPIANNTTGFNAIPTGTYSENYSSFGSQAVFWTSTEGAPETAFYYALVFNFSYIQRGAFYKKSGYAVRCVRD